MQIVQKYLRKKNSEKPEKQIEVELKDCGTCRTKYVIYAAICTKCDLIYLGLTGTELRDRFSKGPTKHRKGPQRTAKNRKGPQRTAKDLTMHYDRFSKRKKGICQAVSAQKKFWKCLENF